MRRLTRTWRTCGLWASASRLLVGLVYFDLEFYHLPRCPTPSSPSPSRFPLRLPGSASTSSLPHNFPTPAARGCKCCWKKPRRWSTERNRKPSLKLKGGETITILGDPTPPPLRAMAEDIPLDIIYEDDDLAVINKPAGMMVHAGAGATDDDRNRGTLVNALLHRFAQLSGGRWRDASRHRASSRQGNQRADSGRAQRRRPSQPGASSFPDAR